MKQERISMKSVTRFFISGLVFVLLLIFMKSWYLDEYKTEEIYVKPLALQQVNSKAGLVENKITLILRYTPELSKYLLETINSFLNVFPLLSILIISDTNFNRRILSNISYLTGQIDVFNLKLDLMSPNVEPCIGHYVKTEFILIVPIGVAATSENVILNLIRIFKTTNASALSIPVNNKINVDCLELDLNLRQWTIEYKFSYYNSVCDAIKGSHALLMHSKTMQKFLTPFMLPFPESLYVQSTAMKMKVKLVDDITFKPFESFDWSLYQGNVILQRQLMYQMLKIKKVIRETGITEWYGCTKQTFRCFGDIVNSVPDYLREGRWTPPCCLKILRETVKHVVKILKEYNVTFWLEGGSLLGAMRMKDIIPWDYDVDFGMYLSDIAKCPWLKALHSRKVKEEKWLRVLDGDGFVWEKSRPEEGKFYRVHASTKNRLHVDIFPFFPKDGIMTKETWFPSHPQDKEFPEHYLQPLTTIEFAGIEVPAPNNIREFLEFKFGKGCVENPQYPHPEDNPFPKELKKFVLINETKHYEV